MRDGLRLQEHSGPFVHSLGGWGKYIKWLRDNHIARWDSASQCLIRLPQSSPKKISRNEPCPCDSGKKYKKCCINGVKNEITV